LSKRGAKAAEGEGDGIDALRRAVPSATSLTLYMCWHGGVGHGYPETVMDAARRLRERHMAQGASDDYISLTFAPAAPDVEDFLSVAPYSDLAYVTDASGLVLAEVSGP
jgi:hypothetical protein